MLSPATSGLQGLWIVVCHDDGGVQSLVTHTLRAAGCRVFEAHDGLACYEMALGMPFLRLLVVNSRLGAMDGPALIGHIRAELPEIAVLHLGPDPEGRLPPDVPTLDEPFSPDQLLTAVSHVLRRDGHGPALKDA
jgi:CheY-like chemotaxis protein